MGTAVANKKQMALDKVGITDPAKIYWNLTPAELIEETILRGMGNIAANGALCINTGKFTGRSPKDRFIVKDDITADKVDWNAINKPFDSEKFDRLATKIAQYFNGKDVFVRDAYACVDEDYRKKIRVFTEFPWSNMFVDNMFLRPTERDDEEAEPDWTVLCAPNFEADPEVDGTRQGNFSIINFKRKLVIVGGSAYTGEIKKGVFAVLNFILPIEHNVLSMHCSANMGKKSDTAIFFGLSGTGKTTLSADPDRRLIGDDEHGWCPHGVFNFEGGCYAKVINLPEEKEPEIYRAIKHGAILENIKFVPGTREVDYTNSEITENTRVSYPIYHIPNALQPSEGGHPRNIFFLTCDAYGVLPPISRLTPGQAMYHFISGYTAKVAGTEEGITEPQTAFSACFGAPFMPLHPTVYAEMLGERQREHDVQVWLINTGWTGGAYGTGSRIKLKYTRAMISAALEGDLEHVKYKQHDIFGLYYPRLCPNVPREMLDPRRTWEDKDAYDRTAHKLAKAFQDNFAKFADQANDEILAAAPKVG